MAEFFDPASALFQIGEDRYGYKYRLSKMRANGWPVYQCIRSTDPNCAAKCLWLYKSSDGHWVATEAPKTSLDPINGGTPTFRTVNPVEDIRARQQLQWQYFKPQSLEWEGAMTFNTYPMAAPTAMMGTRRDLPQGSTAAGSGSRATPEETGASSDPPGTDAAAPPAAAGTGWSVVASADITESQHDDAH